MFSHESLPHCYLLPSGDFGIPFDVGLLDFEWTYAIFNPRKTYKSRASVDAILFNETLWWQWWEIDSHFTHISSRFISCTVDVTDENDEKSEYIHLIIFCFTGSKSNWMTNLSTMLVYITTDQFRHRYEPFYRPHHTCQYWSPLWSNIIFLEGFYAARKYNKPHASKYINKKWFSWVWKSLA